LRESSERHRQAADRNAAAFDRNAAAFDRNAEAHKDLRRFIEEILLRNERVHNKVIAELEDMRRETQAQTRAIFRVLDRLPPGPGNSGAAPEPA
jgi:hypothetical protein